MKKLTVALIQTRVSKDQAANLAQALKLTEQAAKRGAKIICLPELFRTLYFPQYKKVHPDHYAESIPGLSTTAFATLAKKYGVVIIVPVYEKDRRGQYHNSAAVINENGKLLPTYHKIHIPQDPLFWEKNYFKPGDTGYKVYHTKYASFAVLICFDQWFPEAARLATLQGADLIFYPTAIGYIVNHQSKDGDWHDAWETVMRGHAIANGVHVAAVNRTGREDKLNFWGQSFVSDSFGTVLKRADKTKAQILLCQIDLTHNKRVRDGWGFLRHRRPETYKKIV
jgi:agmatine deiminase